MLLLYEDKDEDEDEEDDDEEQELAYLFDSSTSRRAVTRPACVRRNTHPVAEHNFFRCC